MSNPILHDAEQLAHWVDISAARAEFWSAAPSWSPPTGRLEVDGQLLVWTGADGLLTVSPMGAAVAVHLDGTAVLAELAEDLADAAALPIEAARAAVASMAVELQAWGAIEGVPVADVPVLSDPVEPESDKAREFVRPDPVTGQDVRVVVEVIDGNQVTTEHLPDGRRRVTTEFTITSGFDDAAGAAEAIAAAVLAGERSAAELVPPDSCLGAKLRDGDHVPLINIRCVDGQVRSVRCHDARVAAELCRRVGDRSVTTGERGPVEAFVVSPLEGDGPVRIYDGRGSRRGRPRTAGEAVDVVDQILGERMVAAGGHPAGRLPLSAALVHRGDHGVLVPPDSLGEPRVARDLIAAGWTPTWGAAEVLNGGAVSPPSAWGSEPGPAPRLVSAWGVGPGESALAVITRFAGGDGGLEPTMVLERLAEMAERVLGSVAAPSSDDAGWRRLRTMVGAGY